MVAKYIFYKVDLDSCLALMASAPVLHGRYFGSLLCMALMDAPYFLDPPSLDSI
jgi:hypothetical protein